MNTIQKAKPIPIMVSARILRHMSRGIYRTPAGALKELVSNAYDAGATKVTINTGYPVFERIIVTDNGKGMSKGEFVRIVQNIGLTDKVAGTEFKIPGVGTQRVTIGHYGIGLLAIGQLSKRVKITSKVKNSLEGFEATLDFEQFEVTKAGEIERSTVLDERGVESGDKKLEEYDKDEKRQLPIGQCFLSTRKYYEKDRDKSFTRLELESIRGIVYRKLSGNLLAEYPDITRKRKYSANFEELLKTFREYEQDISRGQYPYEKLCWELATYSPVGYPDVDEFGRGGKLRHFARLAESYKFEVVIDGIKLSKPYERAFFEDPRFPIRKVFAWKKEIYAKNKRVSGYLVVKQRIRPKCMQGILVREAGVAIGMYDLTFFEYPYREAAKFEQLTGELFAEGLSGALNIDRSSFNETDEDYLALVKWFHKKLHEKVFASIKKDMAARRKETASQMLGDILKGYLEEEARGQQIKWRSLGRGENLFLKRGRTLYVNKDHPEGKVKKATVEKLALASVLVASGMISPERMEEMLSKIGRAKKEQEKHGQR